MGETREFKCGDQVWYRPGCGRKWRRGVVTKVTNWGFWIEVDGAVASELSHRKPPGLCEHGYKAPANCPRCRKRLSATGACDG